MVRPSSLQIYVPRELCERARATASSHGVSVSEWVGALVRSACDEDDIPSRTDAAIERIARQSLFVMVGVDALLAGHPDPSLRERTHQAFARKLRQNGLPAGTDEGGSDAA
jgi:hypothetical protein